jgi:hypothetical protein
VRTGVLFQHDVVLADRVGFLFGSQPHLRSSRGRRSRLPRLLSGNRRLSRPTLTPGLLPPLRHRLLRRLLPRRACGRPVLPRIFRRYVELRVRRLLQSNRPRPIPPLPGPTLIHSPPSRNTRRATRPRNNRRSRISAIRTCSARCASTRSTRAQTART